MGVGVAGSDITTRVELTCGADARRGTQDAIGRWPEHCTGCFSLRSESAAVLAAGPECLPPAAAPSASCRLTITLGPPAGQRCRGPTLARRHRQIHRFIFFVTLASSCSCFSIGSEDSCCRFPGSRPTHRATRGGSHPPSPCGRYVTSRSAVTTVPVPLDWIIRVPPSCLSRSRMPPNPTPPPWLGSISSRCFCKGIPFPLSRTSTVRWLPSC